MKLSKIIAILLLIPMFSFGNNDKKKHEKSKTIKKEYSVNSDANVKLNNRYGNLNITTWNENRVEIEVIITVKGNDLETVEEKLDGINIQFSASSSLVAAKTIINSKKSGWAFWGKSSNVNYQINYTVKMPITNSVDLYNEYGAINLNKINGKAFINCDYGKISVDELTAENNKINLDYCSQSTIGFLKGGSVNCDYSKLVIEDSEEVKLNQDYSTVTINKTENVHFNADYGHISIDDGTNITGNSDYTGMRFGTVRKSLKIDSDYGSIKIKRLEKGFDSVYISSEYTGIKIGLAPGIVFDFVLDLQYAGFKRNEDKITLSKSISKPTKKYYEGKYGTGKSNSKITINSQYGSVSFNEN